MMLQPDANAVQVVDQLRNKSSRIVFAESCTAGLVAATMGQVPGVSEFLCGSAVTYRIPTKIAWLSVSAEDLDTHTAESMVVTEAMASNVLERTPEASFAAAVTGHLGPNAPAEIDGVVFVSIADRASGEVHSLRKVLESADRQSRQQEAASLVLKSVVDYLSKSV